MDKHLRILCQQFPKTQFLSIDAEKTPFFVQKLGIRSLPTVCFFINGVMKDKLLGFDGLSSDEFLTYELAARMNQAGVI
jgi:thioredoxin-like negative regulator of GroEL